MDACFYLSKYFSLNFKHLINVKKKTSHCIWKATNLTYKKILFVISLALSNTYYEVDFSQSEKHQFYCKEIFNFKAFFHSVLQYSLCNIKYASSGSYRKLLEFHFPNARKGSSRNFLASYMKYETNYRIGETNFFFLFKPKRWM